jgi:zinc protease
MTSVVPKEQKNLIVNGAEQATVFQEQIVSNVQNEEVSQGQEAKFEKTITRHDRSEPPFLETPLFKTPPIWHSSLSNGMKVYGIENREIPLVTFDIIIPGGHLLDPIEKSGIAALMAKMMMQGTAQKTPAQLEEAIDLLGANISITAAQEDIRLQGRCLARNFEPTMALVKEILLHPRWDTAEFERLKKALETTLKGQETNPNILASTNFNKLIYGSDHILGYPLNGTLSSTNKITLEDLKDFYNKSISPTGTSFHLVGAIDQPKVASALKPLQAEWSAKQTTIPSYTIPAQTLGGTVYFIDLPNAKQSVLYIGKLALSARNPESSRLNFANEILGGGSSGKLFQMLRIEKGYTYGAYSHIQELNETAPFIVSTSVRANATKSSLDIIREMLREYGPTFGEKEVEISKNKIMKQNTLAFENQGAKLGILRNISKFNKPQKFIEEEQKELMGMSLADFKETISKYINEKELIYVVVGDKTTQLEEVRKFADGKIVLLDGNGNRLD